MIGEKWRERTEGKRAERNLARPLIRDLIHVRSVHRRYSSYSFVPGLLFGTERGNKFVQTLIVVLSRFEEEEEKNV